MVKELTRRWIKKFMEQVHKAARSKTSTHEIALGMCVGTFISFLPLFGFQVLIGLVAIFLFNINKISTFLGIFVTNPLTIPPIFAFNFYVGKLLLGTGPLATENFFSLETALASAKPLIVGSLLVGFFASIVAYFVTFYVIENIRKELKKLKVK